MAAKDRDAEADDARRLLGVGAEVVGGGAGAAVGLLGGPGGAIAGGAAGVALTRTFKSIGGAVIRRRLEQRQENRAGAAYHYAHSIISARIMGGDEVRADGFFDEDAKSFGRSPAEEILEGALKAAANEHEERKIPYLGAFWANLSFRSDVSRGSANHVLHLVERLTWRQLVLIARAGRAADRDRFGDLGPGEFAAEIERTLAEDTSTDPGVAGELDELAAIGLITRPERSRFGGADDEEKPLSYGESDVASPRPTRLGRLVYELLSLEKVPHEDILDTIADGGDYRTPRRSMRR